MVRIKVLIVSDSIISAGIRMILHGKQGICVVGEASSATSAVQFATREQPEIILVDLDLFGVDLSNLVGDLEKAAEKSHILALSGLGNEDLTRKGICSRVGELY